MNLSLFRVGRTPVASTSPYVVGKGRKADKRYRVRWRCNQGFCSQHPEGGYLHSQTFNTAKEATAFEHDKTGDELRGCATGDSRVGLNRVNGMTVPETFGQFAGLYIEDGRVKVNEDEGWFMRYRL